MRENLRDTNLWISWWERYYCLSSRHKP